MQQIMCYYVTMFSIMRRVPLDLAEHYSVETVLPLTNQVL